MNRQLAIKYVKQNARLNNRELEVMRMVEHDNIVKLEGYFYEKKLGVRNGNYVGGVSGVGDGICGEDAGGGGYQHEKTE